MLEFLLGVVSAILVIYVLFVLAKQQSYDINEKTKTEFIEEDKEKDHNEIDYDRWKNLPLYQFLIEFDELKKENKLSDEQRRRLNKIESEIMKNMTEEEIKMHHKKYYDKKYENFIYIENAESGWIRGLDIDELKNMEVDNLKKEIKFIFHKYILTEDQKQLLIDILYQKMKEEKLIENKDTLVEIFEIEYEKNYTGKYYFVDDINGKGCCIDLGRLEHMESHDLQEELNYMFNNYILTDGQKELLTGILNKRIEKEKRIKNIEIKYKTDIEYNKLTERDINNVSNENVEVNEEDKEKYLKDDEVEVNEEDLKYVKYINKDETYELDFDKLKNMKKFILYLELKYISETFELSDEQQDYLIKIFDSKK